LYIRLTLPEEKQKKNNNNNDDRHIKKRQNKSYCQFFLPFLSVFLSPFQSSSTQKKPRRKRRKKQPIDQHHYRRHRHTRSSHHLASRSDHLLTFIYISTASSSLSSKLYYFNNRFLFEFFFLRIFLYYLHLQLLVCRQYPPNISYLIIYKIQRKVNTYYYLIILLYKQFLAYLWSINRVKTTVIRIFSRSTERRSPFFLSRWKYLYIYI